MEDNQWNSFYEKQAQGQIPYNNQFYLIDEPVPEQKSAPVQLVTPTAQQVEQAKSEMKKKISRKIPKRKKTSTKKLKPRKKPLKRLSKNKRITKRKGRKTSKKTYKRRKR